MLLRWYGILRKAETDKVQIGDCQWVGTDSKEGKGSFGGIVSSMNLLGTYTGIYGTSLVA